MRMKIETLVPSRISGIEKNGLLTCEIDVVSSLGSDSALSRTG